MSVRRHTALNLTGASVPLAVSLVTLPIYLGTIGEARYGVLAIAWLLLGYFGLFDLGLGRATAQRIAALRDGAAAVRAVAFATAVAMNLCLGCLGALVVWPVATLVFTYGIGTDGSLGEEIRGALPWLALALPVATVNSVLLGALQGRERFLEMNLVQVLGTATFHMAPLCTALLYGPDLRLLIPVALLSRLITLVLLLERCFRHIVRGQSLAFSRSEARHLLRFGGWVTVSWIISPLMVALDRFVIGGLSGAAAVTYYTVPFQLAERTTIVSGALSGALFPRLSQASPEERSHLAEEALHILAFILTPLIACAIAGLAPFLTWWISPDFAASATATGAILLVGFWLNSFAMIPHSVLQAQGRPDLVAKCHVAELLPYVLVLVLALRGLEVPGAALAFSLRCGADFLLLAGLGGLLRQSVRRLLLPALAIAPITALALLFPTRETPWWFALAALLTTSGLLATFALPASLAGTLQNIRQLARPVASRAWP